METTKKTQIETLLNGLFDLNDYTGNEGATNYLDLIYIGFISSLECEEMEGRDRVNLTFYFLKLKQLIESSKGLSKEDIIALNHKQQ